MNWLKDIIIGIVIGGGMILPGVSGGVLAVVFGLYEKIIDAITNFFKDWKKSALFLLPIFFGIGIGVIIFGKILYFVFDSYPMEACYTFIGLIIGGIPVLLSKASEKDNRINYLSFYIALILAILLFVLGKDTLNIDFSSSLNGSFLSHILLFITGFLFISGKVIPGISSSFLLMLVGMYKYALNIMAHPFSLELSQYLQLISMTIGMIVGAIILVKIMHYLLKKNHGGTYSAITGFVIGSIYAIYPGFSFDIHGLVSIILLIVSFVISYQFSIREGKKNKQ